MHNSFNLASIVNNVNRQHENKVNFIQITDSHLFDDPSHDLLGINTFDSFMQVLSEIEQSDFNFEFILATGDFIQDHNNDAYKIFSDNIKRFNKPVFVIPGNHDFQPKLYSEFSLNSLIYPQKCLFNDNWQIILLDSQVFGYTYGELNNYQLNYLAQTLAENPTKSTAVIFHHHIISTNSAWLDQHNLRNLQAFSDIIAPYNVKFILNGHIHQESHGKLNNIDVFSTPSTCIQFKPDCHNFTLDTLQPGWREVSLFNDGTFTTQVKRIKNKLFSPQLHSLGY